MDFTPIKAIPDVSFYQDDNLTPQGIDFRVMAAKSEGVIIRAGQNTWIDPDFQYNWRAAKDAGLQRGAYWFYDSRTDPLVQAGLFVNLFNLDPPEWGLWCDIEEAYKGAYGGEANYKKFTAEVDRLFGGVTGVYTGNWWWAVHDMRDDAFWAKYPLWVAQYIGSAQYVTLPRPWKSAVLWQFTSSGDGMSYGVESKEIDLNYTSRAFYDLFGGATPPPTGEDMYYLELSNNSTLNYRTIRGANDTAHILGPYIGQINAGGQGKGVPADVFIYQEDVVVNGVVYAKAGDIWHHCFEANGNPIDGWVAEVHKGVRYLNVKTIGEPPPPAPEPGVTITGVRYSGELVFDYSDGKQEVWHISDAPLTKGPA
jgi:lysozyme